MNIRLRGPGTDYDKAYRIKLNPVGMNTIMEVWGGKGSTETEEQNRMELVEFCPESERKMVGGERFLRRPLFVCAPWAHSNVARRIMSGVNGRLYSSRLSLFPWAEIGFLKKLSFKSRPVFKERG